MPAHSVTPPALASSQTQRALWRQQCLAARLALSPEKHRAYSAQITAALAARLCHLAPTCIGFYMPMRGEFNPLPLVHTLFAAGWQAALPAVTAVAQALEYRPWTPTTRFIPDLLGIAAPDAKPLEGWPDVILTPLLAFDGQGYRLGYGGGYFDRTLAQIAAQGKAPLAIGLGFESGRLASIEPQPHDQALCCIITEAGCVVDRCAVQAPRAPNVPDLRPGITTSRS